MTFENLRAALLSHEKLRHMAFAISDPGQPFCAVRDGLSFHPGFQRGGSFPKDIVEQFFGCVRSVNLPARPQQLERKLITIRGKEVVAAAREAVNHFRPAHFLRAPPGIKIAIALEGEAMLFDAHVTHLHSVNELIDGHPLGALEGVKNFQPLGAADF